MSDDRVENESGAERQRIGTIPGDGSPVRQTVRHRKVPFGKDRSESAHRGSSDSGLWATVWPQALAPRSAGGSGRTGYSGSRRVSPQTTIGGWRNPPRPRVPRRAPRLLSPAPLASTSPRRTRSATRPLGARPRTPPRPCRRRGCEPSRPGVPPARRPHEAEPDPVDLAVYHDPAACDRRPSLLRGRGSWSGEPGGGSFVGAPGAPTCRSPRCRCVPSRRAARGGGRPALRCSFRDGPRTFPAAYPAVSQIPSGREPCPTIASELVSHQRQVLGVGDTEAASRPVEHTHGLCRCAAWSDPVDQLADHLRQEDLHADLHAALVTNRRIGRDAGVDVHSRPPRVPPDSGEESPEVYRDECVRWYLERFQPVVRGEAAVAVHRHLSSFHDGGKLSVGPDQARATRDRLARDDCVSYGKGDRHVVQSTRSVPSVAPACPLSESAPARTSNAGIP